MYLHKNKLIKQTFTLFMGVLCAIKPMAADIPELKRDALFGAKLKVPQADYGQWKKIYSEECKLSVRMPRAPDHFKQKMPMTTDQTKELQYNVFVADRERKEIFMVLVAEYPGIVGKENASKNLEHFLNTLIAQNPKNRLLFADLIDFQGHPSLDFFIRTDAVYFKGRAIQTQTTLYLLALECEIPNYQEDNYKYFIESFELHGE